MKPRSATGISVEHELADVEGGPLKWRNLIPQRTTSRLILAGGLVLVLFGLGWLMFGVAGNSAGMRIFPDADGSMLEVLNDPRERLTLTQVIATPPSDWRPWNGRDYIRTEHGDAVWMRVTLRNPGSEALHAMLADTEYFPDQVEAWVQGDAPEGWTHVRSGEALSAREKPVWGRTAAFAVTVPARGGRVLYLRAEDYYFVYLRPRWWPRAEDFFAMQVRDILAECVCYGGLLALLLYNIVLWARLRFPDTGWYVLYAGAMTAFNFVSNGGLALLGFRAGSPWKEMLVAGALTLSSVFVVQFARVFLGTAQHLPRTDRLLRWVRTGLIALCVGVAAMPWMHGLQGLAAAIVAASTTQALLLVVAVMAWRAGASQGRFFVAAFGLLLTGAAPAVITWLNHDIAAGAARGMLAGCTLEMIMLSFAVADRFAQAQRKLVEETEQRRIIEEAYADELEVEVRERTRELQAANADKDRMLAVIGHDLRSPLTGLMRSADDATGEFARETARTGRTLLLMIEDLVLWARLRAGTRVMAVHRARGIVEPALALHRSLAEHGGIEVRVDVPEELRVETDLVLAQTLVRNLLANALKFADTRVVLRASNGNGEARVTVSNDGPPLSPEVAARFAAGEDEPITATGGLGLRLCREICRALGTRLEAGAAADGGTEFGFTLKTASDATGDNL